LAQKYIQGKRTRGGEQKGGEKGGIRKVKATR